MDPTAGLQLPKSNGHSAPAPEAAPRRAPQVVKDDVPEPLRGMTAAEEAIFRQGWPAGVVESIDDLRGTAGFLDKLATLDEGCLVRQHLAFVVKQILPTGEEVFVHHSWDHQVPTPRYLGGLVAAGHLPEGEYRVIPYMGGTATKHIKFRVRALNTASAMQPASSPNDQLMQLVVQKLVGGPARGEYDQALRSLAERVQNQGERIEALEAIVRQFQGQMLAMAGADDDDDQGGGLLGLLNNPLVAKIAEAMGQAPASAPQGPIVDAEPQVRRVDVQSERGIPE